MKIESLRRTWAVSIDTSKVTTAQLKDLFGYGYVSYKELEEELIKRNCFLNVHGEIVSKDVPIKNRWEILDL